LDIVRAIRNAFAHSKIPIHFGTKEVNDACKLLNKPDLMPIDLISDSTLETDWKISTTTRMRFITICNIMATNLTRYAFLGVGCRQLTRDHDTNDKLQIVARPKPCP
jgi:hypothetical protein